MKSRIKIRSVVIFCVFFFNEVYSGTANGKQRPSEEENDRERDRSSAVPVALS